MEERIKKIIEPVVNSLGYSLFNLEFVREENHFVLRIYIDNEENQIGINDCVTVSRGLDEILDSKEAEFIPGPYNLEVQSPGIDRDNTDNTKE